MASVPNVGSRLKSSSVQDTGKGEATYAVKIAGRQDSSIGYYLSDVRDRVSPHLQKILEEYAGVPREEIGNHMQKIRDAAWSIRGYPCIGLAIFFQPPLLPIHPSYRYIQRILQEDSTAQLMDIGCFLGIDLRTILFDMSRLVPENERQRFASRKLLLSLFACIATTQML